MIPLLVVGLVLVAAALAIGAALVLLPQRSSAPVETAEGSALATSHSAGPPIVTPRGRTALRERALEAADGALRKRDLRDRLEDALELAGIAWQPASFVLALVAAGAAALLLEIVVAVLRPGPFAGVLPVILLIAALLGARLLVSMKTTKRRTLFAEQLDDTLQLVASGLRAGHSLVRALDAVAREAESPTAEEFARVVNENRLGRDVSGALTDVAARMRSDDLAWVAQAVAVHREVGGNLGEVLDHAGETIRDRGRIRRQVKALSAEGRISAYILIALPVFVAIVLAVVSPRYIGQLVTTPFGWVLIAISLVLFIVGTLWMRRVVRVEF